MHGTAVKSAGRRPVARAHADVLFVATDLAEPERRCRRCGSPQLAEQPLASVGGWSRWSCLGCRSRAAAMAPSPPRTLAWAESLRLDFGRYKGRSVGELSRTDDGRGYLAWLLASASGPRVALAIEAARIVLDRRADASGR